MSEYQVYKIGKCVIEDKKNSTECLGQCNLVLSHLRIISKVFSKKPSFGSLDGLATKVEEAILKKVDTLSNGYKKSTINKS